MRAVPKPNSEAHQVGRFSQPSLSGMHAKTVYTLSTASTFCLMTWKHLKRPSTCL